MGACASKAPAAASATKKSATASADPERESAVTRWEAQLAASISAYEAQVAIKTIRLTDDCRDTLRRVRIRRSVELSRPDDGPASQRRRHSLESSSREFHFAKRHMAFHERTSSLGELETPRAAQRRPSMVLKRQMSTMALELRQIVREVELLKPLKHPNIVELKEVFLSRDNTRVHLVLELLTGGDLLETLEDSGRDAFSEDEARTIAKGVLSGLDYLHTRGIAHRDLKSENIMFKRRGDLSSVKIVDFGFARRVTLPSGSAAGGASGGRQSLLRAGSSLLRLWSGGSGLSGGDMSEEIRLDNNVAGGTAEWEELPPSAGGPMLKQTYCGTPHYMAPEVIALASAANKSIAMRKQAAAEAQQQEARSLPPLFQSPGNKRLFGGFFQFGTPAGGLEGSADPVYGPPADMWAFGVVLFRMLSGLFPFDGPLRTEAELWALIRTAGYNFDTPEWESVRPDAQDLLRRLLSVDPRNRPTASQAYLDSWVQDRPAGTTSASSSSSPGLKSVASLPTLRFSGGLSGRFSGVKKRNSIGRGPSNNRIMPTVSVEELADEEAAQQQLEAARRGDEGHKGKQEDPFGSPLHEIYQQQRQQQAQQQQQQDGAAEAPGRSSAAPPPADADDSWRNIVRGGGGRESLFRAPAAAGEEEEAEQQPGTSSSNKAPTTPGGRGVRDRRVSAPATVLASALVALSGSRVGRASHSLLALVAGDGGGGACGDEQQWRPRSGAELQRYLAPVGLPNSSGPDDEEAGEEAAADRARRARLASVRRAGVSTGPRLRRQPSGSSRAACSGGGGGDEECSTPQRYAAQRRQPRCSAPAMEFHHEPYQRASPQKTPALTSSGPHRRLSLSKNT